MKQRLTLKIIAKKLGLSVATVSKALNNDKNVSQKNRDRVQSFAKKNNYKPNLVALSLRKRRTKTIGLVIPEIVHYFFSEIIAGVEDEANKRGYNVVIGVSNESYEKELLSMQMLASGGVDGFLISVSNGTYRKKEFGHLYEYMNAGYPLVMFDRTISSVPCHKVYIDDFEESKKAMNYLLDQGREAPLIITSKDHLLISSMRMGGAIEAIRTRGIAFNEETDVLQMDHNIPLEKPSDFAKALLERVTNGTKIDVVFAVTEISAITVINILESNGIKVPQQIAVMGFADGILAKISRPSLSVVDQHAFAIGKKSCQVLIDQLQTEHLDFFPKDYLIKTSLILRQST